MAEATYKIKATYHIPRGPRWEDDVLLLVDHGEEYEGGARYAVATGIGGDNKLYGGEHFSNYDDASIYFATEILRARRKS